MAENIADQDQVDECAMESSMEKQLNDSAASYLEQSDSIVREMTQLKDQLQKQKAVEQKDVYLIRFLHGASAIVAKAVTVAAKATLAAKVKAAAKATAIAVRAAKMSKEAAPHAKSAKNANAAKAAANIFMKAAKWAAKTWKETRRSLLVWGVNRDNHIYWRVGRNGRWTRIPGKLNKISTGPVGTFGVNRNEDIWYRVGTHEGINLGGTGWQKLPGKLMNISAGKNSVWGVNRQCQTFCISPVVFKDGKIDFTQCYWKEIPAEYTSCFNEIYQYKKLTEKSVFKQISASKDSDVVWGLNYRNAILYRNKSGTGLWDLIPGRLMQVEVGSGGVYGVNSDHHIWYRNGTNANPDSSGTGWTRLPGALKHVTSGRHAIWGVNSRDQIWTAEVNGAAKGRPRWVRIPGYLKQISAF